MRHIWFFFCTVDDAVSGGGGGSLAKSRYSCANLSTNFDPSIYQ